MSISLLKNCFFSFVLFSSVSILCPLPILPVIPLNIPSFHSCSSRRQHFPNHGAFQAKARAPRVRLELVPPRVSEAFGFQDVKAGWGSWCSMATYAGFSNQPVPAPSRSWSSWSCTSWAGLQRARQKLWGGQHGPEKESRNTLGKTLLWKRAEIYKLLLNYPGVKD